MRESGDRRPVGPPCSPPPESWRPGSVGRGTYGSGAQGVRHGTVLIVWIVVAVAAVLVAAAVGGYNGLVRRQIASAENALSGTLRSLFAVRCSPWPRTTRPSERSRAGRRRRPHRAVVAGILAFIGVAFVLTSGDRLVVDDPSPNWPPSGFLVGPIIRLALSRRRELLAGASSVERPATRPGSSGRCGHSSAPAGRSPGPTTSPRPCASTTPCSTARAAPTGCSTRTRRSRSASRRWHRWPPGRPSDQRDTKR